MRVFGDGCRLLLVVMSVMSNIFVQYDMEMIIYEL